MQIDIEKTGYGLVDAPIIEKPCAPIDLTAETMANRLAKVLSAMKRHELDCLLIYADREHGANFGYLTGFEPRFEEAVLVLHKNGDAYLILGNESLRMGAYSRLMATAIHSPYFSLPSQPMQGELLLHEVFEAAGISLGIRLGIVGWKLFCPALQDGLQMFDTPHFILEAAKKAIGAKGEAVNATGIFIHPDYGVRTVMNANEIAHLEFGAALAASRVYDVLSAIEPDKTELELAENLSAYGQPCTVQTICATGERFTNAVVSPRAKRIAVGDKFAVTMGLRGGLTNRCAYIAKTREDLPLGAERYLERVAAPYFAAAATWYSGIRIGLKARELYAMIERVAPKEKYGWRLNPGHFVATEEWMSSPVSPDSDVVFCSGMMLQMDIIFSVDGFGGCNGEDGIALADEALRLQIAADYPAVWGRIQNRRSYMEQTLHISLDESVLPMSDLCGYVRPYLLAKTSAFFVL